MIGSSDPHPLRMATAKKRTMPNERRQGCKVMVLILYRNRLLYSRICGGWDRCWRIAGSTVRAARALTAWGEGLSLPIKDRLQSRTV